MHKNTAGFTLIELSIVLVIIGLIIGGVMVGRELILGATSRKVMSEMEAIQTAVNTFKLKYNCLPGDCSTNFGFGATGNGDSVLGHAVTTTTSSDVFPGCPIMNSNGGICLSTAPYVGVDGAYSAGRAYGEHQYFWAHLSGAGLIKGQFQPLAFGFQDINSIANSYLTRDPAGKGYLTVIMWNRKIYIRTGAMSFSVPHTTPIFNYTGAYDAATLYYITSKFGYNIINTHVTAYPDALAQGQRVIPLGLPALSAWQSLFYHQPNTTPDASSGLNACAASDGAGGFRYNIANNGKCFMLWEIGY